METTYRGQNVTPARFSCETREKLYEELSNQTDISKPTLYRGATTYYIREPMLTWLHFTMKNMSATTKIDEFYVVIRYLDE